MRKKASGVARAIGARKSSSSTARPGAGLPAVPGPGRSTRALVLAVLGLAVCAAFSGVMSNGWVVLDDSTYITGNLHVNSGLTAANLVWFLHAPHGGNWHPITSLSHMLDVQLFGLSAGAHHAVSLAIHVVNVLLLAVLLYRLTGGWWRSVFVAALFGLHPLRVESVAWASERKDVLSMLFFLLTIEAYRRWILRPGRLRYAAVMVALALGLMSKPMLVTAPLLLMLLDVWPLGRLEGLPRGMVPHPAFRTVPRRTAVALAVEKWPLFLLTAASAAVTLWVQRASHAVIPTGVVPVGHRLANAAVSYWRYVGKTIWPGGLVPFYPDAPIPPALAAVCTAGLVAVSVLVLRWWRRQPHLAVGWSWYVISLLPVVGLIQVGGQAYADRYSYIPTVGLLIAVAWLPVTKSAAKTVAAGTILVAALLGFLTYRQVALWKDTKTLFTHTLRVTPGNALAHNCLAQALYQEGDEAGAVREFGAAIASNPAYLDSYLSMATLLHAQGRDEEAIRYCEMGLKLRPDARLFEQEALASLALHRLDDAARLYGRSLDLEPGSVSALRDLAVVQSMRGQPKEALALLHRAALLDPQDPYTQFVLAKAVYIQGRHGREAIERLRRAIALKADWAAPVSTLAMILATDPDSSLRAPEEAVRLAAQAVSLTAGGDADVLQTQAVALAAAGRFDAAAAALRSTLPLVRRTGPDSLVTELETRLTGYEARAKSGAAGAAEGSVRSAGEKR